MTSLHSPRFRTFLTISIGTEGTLTFLPETKDNA